MAKKETPKAAQKSTATHKATPKTTGAKKAVKKAPAKAKKPKKPVWLKPRPTDYVVGTEEYVKMVEKGNELLNTSWNVHRVRPAVFYGIFEAVWKHYDAEQFVKNYKDGFR